MTLAAQISKLRTRFSLRRIVLVGDRGMITDARLEADVKPAGLDWITALRAPALRELAAAGGPLQLSLFDQRDMAEITADDTRSQTLRPMAQSGVLRMPRVQLIRGLARTIEEADLSADDRQTVPQVSSTAGRHSGVELIPAASEVDRCGPIAGRD